MGDVGSQQSFESRVIVKAAQSLVTSSQLPTVQDVANEITQQPEISNGIRAISTTSNVPNNIISTNRIIGEMKRMIFFAIAFFCFNFLFRSPIKNPTEKSLLVITAPNQKRGFSAS